LAQHAVSLRHRLYVSAALALFLGGAKQQETAMDAINEKLTKHWKDVGNLVLGLWLLISPWVLSYAAKPKPAWNAHIVGVIIALVALAAFFHAWDEWVNTALALWLIISPHLLDYTTMTLVVWNQVVVGVLVGILAWTAATESSGLSAAAGKAWAVPVSNTF
jgi:SPW repeat-containing protein